jgi:DNA mismatch repair ATPase MutL
MSESLHHEQEQFQAPISQFSLAQKKRNYQCHVKYDIINHCILQKSSKIIKCADFDITDEDHTSTKSEEKSPFSKAFLDDQVVAEKSRSGDDKSLRDYYGNLDWAKKRLRNSSTTYQNTQLPTSNTSFGGTVSSHILKDKKMLSQSHFISQLDGKFLVIIYDGILCLIDQHAADERIGLEKLEGSIRSVVHGLDNHESRRIELSKLEVANVIKLRVLEKYIEFDVTTVQRSAIIMHEAFIRQWHFNFSFTEKPERIRLLAVPEICGKKSATEKEFINFIDELSSPSSQGLVQSIHSEPQFIKTILSSIACRYAIMFNETLSTERCKELITSLAKCESPFICAHGRPSLVNLMQRNDDRWRKDIPYFRCSKRHS